MTIRSGLLIEVVILHQWDEYCELNGKKPVSDSDFADVVLFDISAVYAVEHPHFGDGSIIVSDACDYFTRMELTKLLNTIRYIQSMDDLSITYNN